MFKIISYYKFHPIADPQEFCAVHKMRCRELQLAGRVYIALEGINGTLAGEPSVIQRYREFLTGLSGFEDVDFKEHDYDRVPFDRLIVKVRPETVSLKSAEKVDLRKTGTFLNPAQWRAMLESGEDYLLLDVRNQHESAIGHFEGAVLPPVENFYDFPQWLDSAEIPRGKKILMYCTGGIRCEKFSAFMKTRGYRDVYQLQGGILNYAKQERGQHFLGKCFVFDDRMAVAVNQETSDPIARCAMTGVPCDTYINCANMDCNNLFICSREAAIKLDGCCSEECRKSSWRRPFNPEDIYTPGRRWYKYYPQKPETGSPAVTAG